MIISGTPEIFLAAPTLTIQQNSQELRGRQRGNH
jgi:hypothetical protein